MTVTRISFAVLPLVPIVKPVVDPSPVKFAFSEYDNVVAILDFCIFFNKASEVS